MCSSSYTVGRLSILAILFSGLSIFSRLSIGTTDTIDIFMTIGLSILRILSIVLSRPSILSIFSWLLDYRFYRYYRWYFPDCRCSITTDTIDTEYSSDYQHYLSIVFSRLSIVLWKLSSNWWKQRETCEMRNAWNALVNATRVASERIFPSRGYLICR